MRILIEEHPYQATEDILKVVSELGPTIGVGGKVSIGYVGYYYNANIQDCVFILPKVLLDEQGRAFQKYNPEDIVHLEDRNNPLNEEERHFVYELSVWIYRAICVFKERNKDTQIVLHERMAQIGHAQRRMSNTFLDILLSLIQFNQDNQDFFFFTIKNLHSGHNKINWTKTIAHSQAYLQSNRPVYLHPMNKRRQVNFDEELMVIYFHTQLHPPRIWFPFRNPMPLRHHQQPAVCQLPQRNGQNAPATNQVQIFFRQSWSFGTSALPFSTKPDKLL